MYCIVIDSLFYFINLNILKATGIFKKGKMMGIKGNDEEIGGGVAEDIPITGTVSRGLNSVERKVKNMSNHEIVETLKYMGVEAVLKMAVGQKAVAWVGRNVKGIEYLDASNYNMRLLSAEEVNKILLHTVSLSLIDLILGDKMSLRKVIKRVLAQLPIPYEKSLVGYQCPCDGPKCGKA